MATTDNPKNKQKQREGNNLGQISATAHNPYPWVVVENPGTENEYIGGDFATMREALKAGRAWYHDDEEWDVMRRNDDGTLTTDY